VTGPPRDSFPWIVCGLALLHLLIGIFLFEPTLFPGGDNAGYLILGDALRHGEGYRDLYLPGAPWHARYPPLLPMLLAGVGVFGGVVLAKAVMLVLTTLAVWVTAHLGRRWIGEGPALLAATLMALNPTLLDYGHYILSEAPFVVLVLLALWASHRDDTKGVVLAMAAAVGAFATRTAGMTILAALPLAWLVEGRRRRAAWSGVVAVATLALWSLYQHWAAADDPGYLAQLVLVDPYTPESGSVGIVGLIVRTATNLWAYVSRVVPQTALGAEGPPSTLLTGFGIALSALALAGWAHRLRRSAPKAPEIFVVLYVGLIAAWPSVWTDRRFLLPLFPLLLLLAARFVSDLQTRFARPGQAALLAAMIFPSVLWIGPRVPARLDCAAAYRAGTPCDPPANASLYAAARWARANTPEGAIIANRKPRLFYWYAHRQGDVYAFSADPDAVMADLDRMGADYVVVDQISGTTPRYLVPAIRAHLDRFEPVYQGGTPTTSILRILPRQMAAE